MPVSCYYRVVDVRPDLQLAVLRDSLGRTHVVRLTAEVPAIGTELQGSGALRIGQLALMSDPTGQIYALHADALECGAHYALERLHAVQQPRTTPSIEPSCANGP